VQSTVAAAERGDLASLDIGGLLGEALGTLSAEMGMDVRAELAADPDQLRAIMQSSVTELAAGMRELDAKSTELYDKLARLEVDLRAETEAFDGRKQLELGDLLDDQNRLRGELATSQRKMQESATKLDDILRGYEAEGDPLTALALFPLKSQDKKAAFIVGLALALKVPYDASMMFAVRGYDGSELFSLFTQALLAFTCLYHYGLVTALLNKPKPPLGAV
jgi:hypothetical protein